MDRLDALGNWDSHTGGVLSLVDDGDQMSLTVRQLSRRDEDKERRIVALEAEVREFRRLIPDYWRRKK